GRRVFAGGMAGNRPRRAGDAGARGESETAACALRPWQGRHPEKSSRYAEGRPVLHLAWVVPGELRDRAAGHRCIRRPDRTREDSLANQADGVSKPSAHAEAWQWYVGGERLCGRSVGGLARE